MTASKTNFSACSRCDHVLADGEECCPDHPDAQVLSILERPQCECDTRHGDGPQCKRKAVRLVQWRIQGDPDVHGMWCCRQHAEEMER